MKLCKRSEARRKEKKNKIGRCVALGLACLLVFLSAADVKATSLSDAQNKKDEAQANLDSANATIDEIEGKQTELQSQIDELDAELVQVLVNLDVLDGELMDKQAQLDEVNAQLVEAQEKEAAQYEAMKLRIKYLYENGDGSYMEAILGATSFSDLLNRVEYAKQVYNYDHNMLANYQQICQQVADLKVQVEAEKAELEEVQESYQEQQAEYESMIAQKQAQMEDFDTQLLTARALADQYKQTVDEQNALIRAEQQRQAAAAAAAAASQSQNSQEGSGEEGSTTTPEDSGKNPAYTTNVSGSSVVAYANSFIGNPYVWGGTSLTNGCDCSGFVMSVYANYGISLPHSSSALRNCGSEVSYANAQPGDIICYAGHVAIYTGNGGIVHAKSSSTGICSGSATYRTILSVRRVL
ncbi:MAG: NlpC/P60 family protein [Lachnospiraceae bacterium]|nr:NlpC/P60 family protein [Lachnospiraceae bacterium]